MRQIARKGKEWVGHTASVLNKAENVSDGD